MRGEGWSGVGIEGIGVVTAVVEVVWVVDTVGDCGKGVVVGAVVVVVVVGAVVVVVIVVVAGTCCGREGGFFFRVSHTSLNLAKNLR